MGKKGNVMKRILINKIQCNKCGEVIESTSRHDFKFCKCGAVAVDGGKDYLRRCGYREDWKECSIFEDIDHPDDYISNMNAEK